MGTYVNKNLFVQNKKKMIITYANVNKTTGEIWMDYVKKNLSVKKMKYQKVIYVIVKITIGEIMEFANKNLNANTQSNLLNMFVNVFKTITEMMIKYVYKNQNAK